MAIQETIVINVKSDGATQNIDNVNKSIKNVDKSTKETNQSLNGITGTLDKVTGGAVSKFKGLTNAVGGVTTGFKSLKVAIIGTGIGALVIAIVSLIQAFSKSEAGQNKFAKLMGVIGSVVGNVTDVLANLGEFIIDLFSGDGKAINNAKEFGKKIFDVVGLPIKNIISVVKSLGSALGALWDGDISGAVDALKGGVESVKNNFNDAKDAIIEAKDAVKGFAEEALREAEIAAQIADQRADADKKERDLIVARAKANRDVAALREKAADKEQYTAEQRIKFLQEASNIEQNITNREIEAAKLRRDAKIAENELDKSNKDALKEEEELKAKVIELETSRLRIQKALTAEITTTRREAEADYQARIKEREDEIKAITDSALNPDLLRVQVKKQSLDEEINAFINAKQKEIEWEQLSAEERKKLEQDVSNAKINIAQNTLGLLGQIAGKDSKIGKAIAIAQTTISTIQGVQNAYTTAQKSPITALFPGYPAIQAGLAGAFGAVQLAQIKSSQTPTVSSSGNVSGGGGRTPSTPTPPQFNIVGQDSNNILSQTIAEQEQQPVQAYVVANDVTTAQSLNNNIVNGASL